MISLLSDAFKYYAAEEGPAQTGLTSGGFVTQEPFESNTAESIQNLAQQALAENSRRPPTVTINQGTVVNIYVTADIDFGNVVGAN
jgi:type IV secretion system protein VirB10